MTKRVREDKQWSVNSAGETESGDEFFYFDEVEEKVREIEGEYPNHRVFLAIRAEASCGDIDYIDLRIGVERDELPEEKKEREVLEQKDILQMIENHEGAIENLRKRLTGDI